LAAQHNDESDAHQVPHAPRRTPHLSDADFKLAVKNALRYFPKSLHATLAPEFARELRDEGHIYMRRFRPREYEMKAYRIDDYPGVCTQAKAIMLMIMNNLSPAIAQFPHELITYGGNGSVFSNWAQYHLVMYYLCTMTAQQTLTIYSGHPAGLFPSHEDAPRCVITNGMVIPNYSSKVRIPTLSRSKFSCIGLICACYCPG
jgi:urocanate hydratase